ncbi:hypothetical protein KIW84_011242 [Lathyrus oleraceus]|uniref:Aminotransferase-like plant mobile domain-containing protein n=1 Tax=Pisum sativum TaxID=3888 RepID=A0A9D4YQA7_PEA|nr:hypothetical protein KIW84_011242 [Pisum sativum]
MLTPTLFDLAAIVGLRPIRENYEPSRPTQINPGFNFSDGGFGIFITDHSDSIRDVDAYEHIMFLTYWLNLYVFFPRGDQILKMFVPLATQLHEHHMIFISKLILCGLYESLGTSSSNIIDRSYLNSLLIGGLVWLLQLWLNATFVPPCTNTPSNMIWVLKVLDLPILPLMMTRQCCRRCLRKVVLPENPGHLKGDVVVRVMIESVLTFDAKDAVEVEDTPLKMRRRSGTNYTPDLGPASSSLNLDDKEISLDILASPTLEDRKGHALSTPNPSPPPGILENMVSRTTAHATTSSPSLLGAVNNDLSVLAELRELMFKLGRPEIPAAISAFSLDLEILLDQSDLVTRLKRPSTILVEEKYGALS